MAKEVVEEVKPPTAKEIQLEVLAYIQEKEKQVDKIEGLTYRALMSCLSNVRYTLMNSTGGLE